MRPVLGLAVVWLACGTVGAADAPRDASRALFDRVLASTPRLRGLAAEPERYRMQILFAEIEREPSGRSTLVRYAYREDSEYWYPASTVKLLAAGAALAEIDRLAAAHGAWITVDTPLVYHPLFDGEQVEGADATPDTAITVRREVRKSLIVSDNEAFNKLYELCGQDGLDAWLRDAGLEAPRIVHRLAESRSADEHRRTPRIDLVLGEQRHIMSPRRSERNIDPGPMAKLPGWPRIPLGRAHVAGDRVVNEPLEFGGRNRVSLRDLQNFTAMIARPDVDLGLRGPELSPTNLGIMLAAMTDEPAASVDPRFDPAEFGPYWKHFFMPGLERVARREDIFVANKIGLAYGFSSETAYIEHRPSGLGFFLAMTVYTNDNAVLNDGVYEYDLGQGAMADVAAALADRVFGGVAAPEGTVRAPVPYRHEPRVIAAGTAIAVPAESEFVSAEIPAGDGFTECVASYAITGGGARVEIAARAGGAWSPWLALGEAGRDAPADAWQTQSDAAHAEVDTLVADGPIEALRVRVRSGASGATVADLRVCLTFHDERAVFVDDERADGRVECPTPFLSNAIADEALRGRLCSPLSLRMLLAQRGVERPIAEIAERVYDQRAGIYGNWASAIRAAADLGVPGALHRFSDWASVRDHLREVGPIAVSMSFSAADLPEAGYDASEGHIAVLYGLNEAGDALMLDPAYGDEALARRVFPREAMTEVWLRRAKGLAYALRPPGGVP